MSKLFLLLVVRVLIILTAAPLIQLFVNKLFNPLFIGFVFGASVMSFSQAALLACLAAVMSVV